MEKKTVTGILITLVFAMAVLGLGFGISTAVKSPDSAVSLAASGNIPMVPGNFSELAERARPAVMNIGMVKTMPCPKSYGSLTQLLERKV